MQLIKFALFIALLTFPNSSLYGNQYHSNQYGAKDLNKKKIKTATPHANNVFKVKRAPFSPKVYTKKYRGGAGTIIILNGPSASGKSSIQKSIQHHFRKPFISLGIDNLFNDVIPDEHGTGVRPQHFDTKLFRYVKTNTDVNGNNVITLHIGPWGQQIVSGMHHAIAAYADQGNNVIVDYILYDKHWLKELSSVLEDYKVYFIGVKIPLDVLEKRERSRGTSPVGHARSHYFSVHDNIHYDFEVDTSKLTADQAALAIRDYMIKHPDPKALSKNLG